MSFFTNKKLILIIFVFLFSFILRLWHLNDVGRAWDEQFVLGGGHNYFQLLKKFDLTHDYWWKIKADHPPFTGLIRGAVSESYFIGRDSYGHPLFTYDYPNNRLISVILTSLTSVIVFLIGARYFSLFIGTCSGMILSTLPILLGHTQLAMYEPFNIFFFTITVYSFFLFLEASTLKKLVITGILLGLSVSAKESNMLLVPLLMLIYLIFFYYSKGRLGIKELIVKILLIYFVGATVFFILWPASLIHFEFMISYIRDRRFSTQLSIPEVFFGKLVLTPRIYFVIYFLITTPLAILLFFLYGLLKINKSLKNSNPRNSMISNKKRWLVYSIILWFVFPFIQSLYPAREQGIRYIIQIYSPFSIIAAIGFDALASKITKRTKIKILLFIPVIAYLLITIFRIAPYYLEYFNESVGGINNVYEKRLFQYGGWGEGLKEAALYLESITKKGDRVGIALVPSHTLPPMTKVTVEKYNEKGSYDYVMVNYYNVIRDSFPIENLSVKYKLIHTINADKAPLVFIFKKK